MSVPPFPDRARFDARDKVLGRTLYAADYALTNALYAMIVPATIAKGRVVELSTVAALRVPGVVRVLTSDDFQPPAAGSDKPIPPPPTLKTAIDFRGEPVALVLAETIEAAIEGAEAVRPRYAAAPFSATVEDWDRGRKDVEPRKVGDAAGALAGAATVVDQHYEIAVQHHNPIELIATTAEVVRGRLVIHQSSQAVGLVKTAVADALGIAPDGIDVKSEAIGGGFGQKGLVQRQTALVARAAMLTGRPVKLVAPRGQIFHLASYRGRTRHRVRLAADTAGRMTALAYDAVQENTAGGPYSAKDYHETPGRLYGIGNYLGTAADILVDRQTPGWMRGTHSYASCFAIESAVDELAHARGVDPLALRLANDAAVDPMTGRPFSSRFLNECLSEGARRFGWERRDHRPGSMRSGDGTLVGWGMACGIFQMMAGPGEATLRVGADGSSRLVTSGHEMGQGIRTVLANMVLSELDLDPARLEIVIGDTSASPQLSTSGQWGTASVVPVTKKVVGRMKAALAELHGGRPTRGTVHEQLARARRPFLTVKADALAPGQKADALETFRKGGFAVAGPEFPPFTGMTYAAHFVELHIEPSTRRVRMPRAVSIADCGRVVSPRTARSQMLGGVVWGFGQALREGTEIDPRYGGYLNNDLADYVVPVNADIGEIDVGFVDKPDPVISEVGAKGLGEVVMVGASAAIANAIFHATGRRLRRLPMRVEDVL